MPELPEVETVVRGLQKFLPGRKILGVRLGKTDFIKDPAALERDLPGKTIKGVRRYGKFIVFDLKSSDADSSVNSLLVHLGMTGQLVTCSANAPAALHTHVFFALDDGRELRYTDVRRFGRMRILSNGQHAETLGKLGSDPLEASLEEFTAQISRHRAMIKALLLNQSVFRGIGNIYTDESLWRAKINPRRLGANLKPKEVAALYRSVQGVLNEAIRLRGSSISDYVDAEGERGEFQLRHRVYQREGEKCARCKTVIRRVIVAGRSSYFCPRCQPLPHKKVEPYRARAGR